MPAKAKCFDGSYKLLRSADLIIDKNFYLITALQQYPELLQLLPEAEAPDSNVAAFRFTDEKKRILLSALANTYDSNYAIADKLLDEALRPSGNYQLYCALNNKELWIKAWELYFIGINYIIDQYGVGLKMRYPKIDSASYYVNSEYYKELLQTMFVFLQPKLEAAKYFYESPLLVARQLMEINNRDEAARHEPLELNDNHAAMKFLRRIKFNEYKYPAIIVPGDGPIQNDLPLSPNSKMRCVMAAEQLKNKIAPVIVLTGGYCHPFQTKYAEAVEMKKYLVQQLHIPAEEIFIEPHARHTTTNFRNASRLIYRNKIPVNKPFLFLTTQEQADYIINPQFKFNERNIRELGYMPYRDIRRVGVHAIEFFPVIESLHRDPTDPLDP